MIDVTLFLLFGVAVMSALLVHSRYGGVVVTGVIGVLLVAHVGAVLMADPVRVVRRLRHNSQLAAKVDAMTREHPALPVVFYMADMRQPLIFPSPDLYAAIRVAGMPGERRYLRRYHPRLDISDPAAGPRPGPHVLIVPEYLALLPRTPETLAEWPDIHGGVDVIARDARFAEVVASPQNGCRVFQFEEEDRRYLHNFWVYATKVTVCVVRA
jgi:hypothetical protein